jgi:23S rRNA pseudouridine1911/1915/1917 synthase
MLKILFEDKHVVVVVKPPGMPCQPDPTKAPSLLEAVQAHMKASGEAGKTAKLVHRLDRPVGGVMVYAKTREAAGHLSAQFADGRIKKRYLAVVQGQPIDDSGHLVHQLKVTQGNVVEVAQDSEGQTAELKYRVIGRTEAELKEGTSPLALLDVLLLTGRRHQIRVQLSASGFPILGDAKYNPDFVKDESPIGLWSYEIRFYHPAKRTALSFRALPGILNEDESAKSYPAPWHYFSGQIAALEVNQS